MFAEPSDLWGYEGEKWTPASRLPDFSQAGYRRGECSYRIPTEMVSLADLGAKGDGKTNDTEAFKKALTLGPDKLLLIPKGRFLITDQLEINQPRVVMRGAGAKDTVLVFNRPLQEIKPTSAETGDGMATTGYSWGGGLIQVVGKPVNKGRPASVTKAAKRGDTRISVTHHAFKPGNEVLLMVTDESGTSLLDYLHRGQARDFRNTQKRMVQQVFRVVATTQSELTLDRGLRFDLKPEWQSLVFFFAPEVTDVGIEELGFEFPAKAYAGHWREVGYNPVALTRNVAHCWVRNVRVWNCDSGPFVSGWFCSVDGIFLGADRRREYADGISGHHGVVLNGKDNLCTRFEIQTKFFHDVSVSGGASGNVFSLGMALNFNMDHHKGAPYENLFTDIDAGEGTRLFHSGGAPGKGNHSAAGATFWNIRSRNDAEWPEHFHLDAMNFVGLKMGGRDVKDPDGRWIELISPTRLTPPDLHMAMRQKRLSDARLATSSVGAPQLETHSWENVDGRVIEAQFGGIKDQHVLLIRANQTFEVPLIKLTPESRVLARNLAGLK